jgi:Tol biopolymer transport system component
MRSLLTIIAFIFLAETGLSQQVSGLPEPTATATLFSEGMVSSSFYERDMAISPDGTEMYYSLVIGDKLARLIMRRRENGNWSMPRALPFSDNAYDIEPALSPDGTRLFFASNRTGNFDIYVCKRQKDGSWSEPSNIGLPINTTANEYYPSVSVSGAIYYTAKYEGGVGGEDIWVSDLKDGIYQKPRVVPGGVNTARDEYNAFVDPQERFILFGSFGRPDDVGRGDIYKSERSERGEWQPAVHLGSNINSPALDYCPYVTPDGKILFISTERALENERPTNPFRPREILKGIATPKGGGNVFWLRLN